MNTGLEVETVMNAVASPSTPTTLTIRIAEHVTAATYKAYHYDPPV